MHYNQAKQIHVTSIEKKKFVWEHIPATLKVTSLLVKFVAIKQVKVMLSSPSCTPVSVVAVEFTSTTVLPSFRTPVTLKRKMPRSELACVSSLKILPVASPVDRHRRAPPIVLQVNAAFCFGHKVTFPTGESRTG